MRRTHRLTLAVTLLWLVPSAAFAQNREHLQLSADLRMVQEQVSRLQLANNQLAEQLKAALKRIDDLNDAQVKNAANQQALINQIGTSLATVREKLDDNTVRVSQLTPEMTAVSDGMRLLASQINKLVSLLQPPVASASPASPGTEPDQGAAPATAAAPPTPANPLAVTLPSSPAKIFAQAFGNYESGNYDIAIEGFREFIDKYPTMPDAAVAQLSIGDSYYQQKKCREAIPEYQKVITNYKTSDRLAEAYYSQGVCFLDLNQRANATRVFELVVKQYPNTSSAMMAAQKLQVKP